MAKKTTKAKESSKGLLAMAVTRILLGFVFLWAFLDKTFGLGFATESAKAWVNGGSPTTGFLKFGVNPDSPFADFFGNFANKGWFDFLFMAGLLVIGLALIFGVALKLAAVFGTIMLVMMWMALIPLENNPVIDDHIVYATVLWVFVYFKPALSMSKWWESQSFVKKYSFLK